MQVTRYTLSMESTKGKKDMFEKSLEVLNNKVSNLQEQLLLQIKALETAQADRKLMAEKVYALIHSVYDSYGVDGLNDVNNAIALFISQQEVPVVAEAVVETEVEASALVATESIAEAVTEPKPKAARKRAATKSKEEATAVPVTYSAPPMPEFVTGFADEKSPCYQTSLFGAAFIEQEAEPADTMPAPANTATVQTEEPVHPAPERPAHLNLDNPSWINFDQKTWLEDRQGTPADELSCFYDEKITNLLREGWAYNEIPLTHGTLSDGTTISPENPDPCERLAPVITLLTEDRTDVRKVFEYGWFSKIERAIIDKMFATIYPADELSGWKKVLHIVERLTGLVDTSDETIEKAGILTPIGLMKSLACAMTGTTVVDKKGNKVKIKSSEWKKYLVENVLSPEEITYLKENFR